MLSHALTVFLTTLVLGAAGLTVFTKQFRSKRATGSNDTDPLMHRASGEHPFGHKLEGEKQMVFTHQINLPSQSCECPDRNLVRTLLSRLEALETQVMALKQTCPGGGGTRPGPGPADARALCAQHGKFDQAACKCQCDAGWKGPTCSEPSCPSDCHGRGTCVDGSCFCQDGFMGESCEETSCPDDCNDQGRCVQGRCVCFRGYTGPSCGDPSCPEDCGSHGRCVQDVCICEEGFSGPDCSTKACPENCRNQGQCFGGKCICDPGFTGPDCGTKTCPENCRNRGRCVNGKCVCDVGFAGPDCSTKSCPENCRNRGRCVNGKCVCISGYTGPDCGARACPENCRNRGQCVNGKCICNPGYTGVSCGNRMCPDNCSNRGRCVDGRCICDTGFSGPNCGTRTCPDNCMSQGQCVDGRCICDTGFTGPNCGTKTCPDNCMDQGQCYNGQCICDTGFTGTNCATRTCPGNCMDQGQCADGRCICDSGFTGPNCASRTCPDNCMDQGQCADGRCICDSGFTGLNCATRTCPDNCMSRGKCVDGECICDSGFTGPNCATRTCPDNCMDRGQCIDGRCICDSSFTGPNCATRTCPDNCMDRGQCVDGRCICDSGFTGPNCATRTCPDNCMDRGQCVDGRCICDSGFTGPNCATRTCPDNCMDQGQCVDGRCICDSGFAGPNCATRTCPDNCMDRGQCVDGRCICDSGLTGPNCVTRTCPDNCMSRGQCVDGQCICKPGYTGQNCGTRTCPNNCSNQGRCENGKCVCDEGYYGPICGNKACSNNCNNRGRCLKGACVCRRGYTGPDCGEAVCPNECSQRGTCQDGKCLCAEGYGGEDCSEEVPAVDGLVVKSREETSATVEWNRPRAPVDGYEISFTPTKEDNGIPPAQLSSTATSFHQTGLAPGQEYKVTIRAQKSQTLGPETTKTFTTPIDAPKALHPTDVTPSSIRLQWERPVASVDRYLITYIPEGGRQKRVQVPAAEDHVQLKDLDSATEYDITVVSQRAREQSKPVSIKVTTAPPGPRDHLNHLGNLTVENKKATSFRLAWKARKGAYDSFLVRYEDTADQLGPQETSVLGDLRSTVVKGLRPDTEYAVSLYGVRNGFLSRPLKTAVTTASLGNDGIQPRIEDLSASDIKGDSVRLSWTVLDGDFDYFLLQYKDPQGQMREQTIRGDLTSTLVSGLRPSQNYTFILCGISDDKRSEPLSIEVTTGSPDYLLPQLGTLSVSDVTENSLQLSWTVLVGDFDSFLLQYRDSEGKTRPQQLSGNLRTATISNLRPAWTYKFNLYGMAAEKHSKPISVEATTAPAVPSALGDLSISDVSQDSLQLSWTVQGKGFDSFLVMYRDSEGRTQRRSVTGDKRTATISGLAPETKYKFHLYGVSGKTHSKPKSAEATTAVASSTKVPPQQPSLGDLSFSDVTEDALRLTWTVPNGGFDSFLIQYRDTEGKPHTIPVSGDLRSTVISGLKPSRKYKFILYGVFDNKRSKPVAVEANTALVEKARLGDLSISNITVDSLQLSWTVPDGNFDSFLIMYRNALGEPQEVTLDGSLRDTTISGLKPAKKYKFILYGVSDDKRSKPASAEAITGKTILIQKAAVGDLSASNVTKDSLQLSWTVQEGKFDSFLIQYKDAEGKPLEVQVDGDHQTTTVLDLKPGKKYKFTLYGVLNNKRTKPLITEATTVSPQIAATLGDLSISNITEDAVQLSWTVQDGEFDSFLIQYTDEEGKTREVPIDEELRSTIISGLEPSKKYNFNLYGVLNHVRSTPVSAEAITAPSKTVTQKATLEDLSISSVTEDSLQLTWTVSDGEFDSFLIQYTDEEGKTREVPIDGELHTTIISGLEPSMKYNFNIYGILNNKPSTPVSAEATTASPKKATLEDLSISNVNKDSLQLSWTVKDGEFDSFLIQYTDEEGKTLEVPVDGELHTTTIPGLEPSMTYKFNIYGILNNEYTAPVSAEATTAAKEETVKKVPVPGDLSVFNITEDSLWLSWTTKDGQFDSFLIQYKDAEGKLQEVPIDGDLHTTLISGLKPFKKYKFNLYGVLENKHSEPVSTEATTVKKTIQKAKLEDLSISDITEDSLRLSWTVQDGNFDSFLILYKNTDGELQEVPIDGKHQTTIITGLKPSKKYKFVLYGVSDNKRSKPVSAEAITVIPKATLGDLSISNITEDSLQLSWTVQDGKFDSFLIQYKDVEGKLQEVPVDGDFDKTTISGLKPSKKYKFSLYGVLNSKRSKPVSAEAITAEKPSGQQPQLRDLSVSDVTEHSIRLSWTVQGGDFDSFLLLYRDQEGRAQKVPVAGNERSVTITGLVPDRRVKFYLHGISGNTRSKPVSVEALTASPTKATPGPPQLQDLTASDITDSSLKLSWTTQDGEFDSFIIQYKNADGELQEVPIDRSQNTATIGGLKSAKKYKFHLYGIVGDRRTQPIFVDATTALTVPSLKDLAVSDITEDTLRLSWTIRDGEFDSFVIQYRDAEGKPQEVPVHRDDNTAIISGLKPAKNYKFTLYGIYDNKRSKPISTEATTDPLKKPLIPPRLRDLEVSDITKNSLQLSWKVQDGVFDSFVVQYKDSENRIHEVPVNGNERSTTILGLLPSHKYKFNLYGITGDTASKPESIEANTAHIAFPEVIGQPATMLDDLYISDVGSNALQLSWEAPKEAFDSFLVQYGVSTAAVPKRETVVAGDLRKILIGGLHPNTKYNFTLSGIQAGQMRANLSTTGQTSRLAELEAPRDLQFSNITETSTTVSWTPPMASVERYKVSFQLAQGGEPQSVNVDSGTTKTTLTGLIPGSRYEVSVMALRGFEESEPLTGFLTTVPDGPTNLRAVNVDDSSALLVWKPPLAAVDSYIIAYEAENAPAVTRTVSGSSSSLPLSGLSVDTEYKVEIHSVRGSNSSSPSSTTFTTGADAPRDLTASEVTPRSALLSWTAPQVKSTGYILTYETPSREKKEVKLAPSVTSLELWDLIPANLYQARLQALRGVVRTAPTSTSFTTGRLRYPFPRDCVEEYLNGITRSRPATIYLGGDQNQPMKVFCDMETDGGGWIVFQRRMNGKTDFWRDWEEYAVGFGNLSQEFWLGNNNLNRLTSQAVFELRVDLHSGNDSVYALYDYFRLEPESKYFRLRLGKYSGTAGDSLSYHIGSVFSTRDRDYNRQILPCAVSYRGAWWYRNCHYSNLNGMYSHSKDHQGITWYSWKGFDFSIPFTEMKLRPRNATALRKL
uniref:Tenascin-X isoform X5 n=1 Tax=Geotrypetes seraphini TaxID=260995 RepID=A0A6P8P7C5_GEOSA|nr:tenascin-X isoform X5 [Geotrypetes seraphini]